MLCGTRGVRSVYRTSARRHRARRDTPRPGTNAPRSTSKIRASMRHTHGPAACINHRRRLSTLWHGAPTHDRGISHALCTPRRLLPCHVAPAALIGSDARAETGVCNVVCLYAAPSRAVIMPRWPRPATQSLRRGGAFHPSLQAARSAAVLAPAPVVAAPGPAYSPGRLYSLGSRRHSAARSSASAAAPRRERRPPASHSVQSMPGEVRHVRPRERLARQPA